MGLIGLLPNVASAHSRFFVGFNVGVPFVGVGFGNYYGYRPAYCGVSYYYAAPPAAYCPPVVYGPSVYRYPVYYHYHVYHRPYYYGGANAYYYYGR
jgi:hypothetical protein